ncbi:Glutaredoxin like [Actinidia chinensis var. chinensis]|uniref:Glutaredoxin like n=1 Tax=Actinidia chinensis var. chinensis TaxID=1590841 RepID=A0A2R6Q0S8_ACTCC|nr:Glutaredoxin like [Actinidia chinensis var. chinensis]
MSNVEKEHKEKGDSIGKNSVITQPDEMMEGNTTAQKECEDKKNVNAFAAKKEGDTPDSQKGDHETEDSTEGIMMGFSTAEKPGGDKVDVPKEGAMEPASETKSYNNCEEGPKILNEKRIDELNDKMERSLGFSSGTDEGTNENLKEIDDEEEEPVFDGTEVPGMEANRSTSTRSLGLDPETQGSAWPEKATTLKNFVRNKSAVAVSSVLRRLSGKSDDGGRDINDEVADSSKQSEAQEASPKTGEKFGWNPLSLMKISRNVHAENKQEELINESLQPLTMKGRVLLYTRLGCPNCREGRYFLHRKKLRYIEINIDVYPSRKLELEKIAGSSAVPRVFFNEILIGGLTELKGLDEAGKLDEKIEYVITEVPPFEAPLPPLSGEDDMSTSGVIDELSDIVRKMKEFIPVKDRFYKMRRFINCFLGSEAVNFLSEDQYLEREEAVEFGRKLASKLFFQHVLDENVFEDGNHLYRFLDHDPIVTSQCYNIPRGITEVKPKPIIEIASRLRFLSYAIFEAYISEDGKHVDYRSIHGSEEFARYLRIVEELQRVDLQDMPREEKLAFFINLFNMMVIHAILVWGHPAGALERRKLLGDFKYVIGGCTYSLSAIQNGILRANQRPPYNLIKPFGLKDKRFKVSLPYSEPLIHFALVCGNRSGPALRCYSPGNIDKELTEAACNFLRNGGLVIDLNAKVASVSKILKWYSIDFGKNEVEVLKHAANYLEPDESEALLVLLATTQLKVVHQPYDWGLNY